MTTRTCKRDHPVKRSQRCQAELQNLRTLIYLCEICKATLRVERAERAKELEK
jgi:hypothetical protein